MSKEKIAALMEASRILYERRLLHATGGNTSIRDGDYVWISQTGAELGSLTEQEVVKVDLQGNVIEGEAPSMELGMHLAMYRARRNAGAVIHAHPTFAITLSTLIKEASNDVIRPYTAAFYFHAGRVPMIPYHGSGSHALHVAVEELADDYHALLLKQHGLIVAGSNMTQAVGMIEEIEQCCQISVASGMQGEWLSAEQCAEIDRTLGRTWKI